MSAAGVVVLAEKADTSTVVGRIAVTLQNRITARIRKLASFLTVALVLVFVVLIEQHPFFN